MPQFKLPDSPAVWVMAGDTITQGARHTYGARCWVEHVHERVRYQLGRFFDLVVNSGLFNGTAAELLENFDPLIGRFNPQLVSLSLGTWDCLEGEAGLTAFEGSMRRLIEKSLHLQATVIVQTPALVMRSAAPNLRHLSAYAATLRALAAEYDCNLVDHEAYWQSRFGEAEPIKWMDDDVHPNAVGHLYMAQAMFSALEMGRIRETFLLA